MRNFILFCMFLIIIFGLVFGADEAPKPLTPEVVDIPGDGGTNVILKWLHFETVPGFLYEIFRSEDGGEFELISPYQLKSVIPIWEDSTINDVSDWGYYAYKQSVEGMDFPNLVVAKLTPENKDSLMSLGAEKIVRIEFEVPPYKKINEIPNIFAPGQFYQIIADPEKAKKPQPYSTESILLKAAGISLPVEDRIGLEITAMDEEFEFVEQGNRIVAASEVNPAYLAKYGSKITSIVTEKARYTMKFSEYSYVDRTAKPDTKFEYKIRLYQVKKPIKKVYNESEPVGITPVDELPFAPNGTMVLMDTTSGSAAFHFNYDPSAAAYASFLDNKIFVLYKTTHDDTLCENGAVIDSISASWMFFHITGIHPDDAFYVEAIDIGGQSTKTGLIIPVPVEFSIPVLPEIRVTDQENDDGTQLALRWGPPTLFVSYSIEDIAPKTEINDVSDRNLYIVHREDGDTIMSFGEGDTIPENSQKILTVSYTVPGGKKSLTINFKMQTNVNDKALYAEFDFDGTRKIDKENAEQLNFDDIAEGTYNLKGWIVNTMGGKIENPEAQVDMEIDATGIHSETMEIPPYVYVLYRGTDPEDLTTFELVGQVGADSREVIDVFDEQPDEEVYYIAQIVGPDGAVASSDMMGPFLPKGNLFNFNKITLVITALIFLIVALYFIYHSKKGKEFFIRPIAGIVHVDEALGRATEMGKPIVYVLGLGYIDNIATLASLTILGRVARKAAEYQNRLLVPCYDPIVMIVAQETVRNAYMDAGRPDLYREEDVYYIAAQQFAYAAAVSGLMIREKTAGNFFIGKFYAESLILAETGASTGAIQVAGTDDMTQLPFFITACDYTLIGEELYAASAYMSNDPMQKGALKSQDFLKAIEMLAILIGTIAATGGLWWFVKFFEVVGE